MLISFYKTKSDSDPIEKSFYMFVIDSSDADQRVGPSFESTLTPFDAFVRVSSEKILPEILEGTNGLKEVTVESDEKVKGQLSYD